MAERLADIATQIENVRQLGAVVTAMRGIAASRAQKGRTLLAGIEAYTDVVSHAIGQALMFLPSDMTTPPALAHSGRGLIIFCAEQGFAGAFSEHVLDAAGVELKGARIFLVGTRGAVVATERGIKPAWSTPMATNVDGIASFANRLADALYGDAATGAIGRVDIVFSRSAAGGGIRVDRHSLLPLDFRRFARPIGRPTPLTTLAPQLLLERLTAEYVYAQLCEAAMYSFEAENEARMMAMASAKTNVENKLASLAMRERQLRQEEITTEVIELSAGADPSPPSRR